MSINFHLSEIDDTFNPYSNRVRLVQMFTRSYLSGANRDIALVFIDCIIA